MHLAALKTVKIRFRDEGTCYLAHHFLATHWFVFFHNLVAGFFQGPSFVDTCHTAVDVTLLPQLIRLNSTTGTC